MQRTWLFSMILAALAAPSAHAGDIDAKASDVVRQAKPACVFVAVFLEEGSQVGSGFVVDPSGLIVTSYHVVQGAKRAQVTFADGTIAKVTGFRAASVGYDAAVLQVDRLKGAPAVKLSKELPRVQDVTIAIGAPMTMPLEATQGTLTAVRRGAELKPYGFDVEGTWLQMSTPIASGFSGGPVLNLQGQVVGVSGGAFASSRYVSFALSSTSVAELVSQAQRSPLKPLAELPHPR